MDKKQIYFYLLQNATTYKYTKLHDVEKRVERQ